MDNKRKTILSESIYGRKSISPKGLIMSSGKYKPHRGFNPVQIKDGMVVRLNKNGTVRAVLGKYGEYGKDKS